MEKYKLYNGKYVLEFDPQKHIYYVDGEVIYGVTNIVGIKAKPALMYWAVNQAVDSMKKALKAGVPYTEVELAEKLGEAKSAHRKFSGRAQTVGTLVHDYMEEFIKAGIKKEELPKMPVDDHMKKCVKSILKWFKDHKVKIKRSERKVLSIHWAFAGTEDWEGLVNGKLCVGDFKVSGGFYPEYWLQLAAYLHAREEETKKKYHGAWLLRLDKITGEMEARFRSKKELENDFKAFIGARVLYEWDLKNKFSSKK